MTMNSRQPAPRTRRTITAVVTVRNETTHELPPKEMRLATESLLNLIDAVLNRDAFVALLTET